MLINWPEMLLWKSILAATLFLATTLGPSDPAQAGPYRSSAHGSTVYGVYRGVPGISTPGPYIRGNCAHCHEQHASVGGKEPVPEDHSASPFALFSPSFDKTRQLNPYQPEDVFCFQCHGGGESLQVSAALMGNFDYARNFGGVAGGPNNILEAFNQPAGGLEASYHNLYDIWNYSQKFDFFKPTSSPCSACHNPHRSRQNQKNVTDPEFSAISPPSAHESLWGDSPEETMAGYNGDYQPPLHASFSGTYEPGGIGEALANGSQVPDYNIFCLECHSESVYSTTQSRFIPRIDWSTEGGDIGAAGDKHGRNTFTGELLLRPPYTDYAVRGGNFVLSCLDCHEPHGSPHSSLIRRGVNGSTLYGTIAHNDSGTSMGFLCRQCHQDDYAAGSGNNSNFINRWREAHHGTASRPYIPGGASNCATCHEMQATSSPLPIGCGYCHGHGMTVDANTPGVLPNGKAIPAPVGDVRKTF